MRTYPSALILGLALLAPLTASAAAVPPPPGADVADVADEGPGGPWREHRERYIQERLNQLHKELKLTPAQEADWSAFSTKVTQAKNAKKEARSDFESLKQMPAPDRLQKMIDFGKARQASLEEILAATKTFYATLSPEQRKVFDDLTPFGERAPHWKGRGPHHPRPQ